MKKWFVAGMVCLGSSVVSFADTPAPAETTAPAATAAAPTAGVSVDKMAVGTAVENRELTGAASEFTAATARITCWMHVNAESAPVTVKHVWYADDKKEAEVPLEIKSTSARTWSSKNVWPGKWKVEAVGPSGDVLKTVEFTVK